MAVFHSQTQRCLLIFIITNIFKKFIKEYHQSVKQFGSRSGPTKCQGYQHTDDTSWHRSLKWVLLKTMGYGITSNSFYIYIPYSVANDVGLHCLSI